MQPIENWLDKIVAKEQEYHLAFFGKDIVAGFDYSPFRATLEKYGEAKFAEWRALGLEPHYLSSVGIYQNVSFPGWELKPESWYYKQVEAGNVGYLDEEGNFVPDKEALKLRGITVLVDVRCKPSYRKNKQMWKDDNLLGPIIEGLRTKGKIAKYEDRPQSSRLGISSDEAEQRVWPSLAERLGLERGQVRSERAVEFNVFSQMLTDKPRFEDGGSNTWVWFADVFEDANHRLRGGDSSWGGLAAVTGDSSDYRWCGGSVRPLVVLNP